MVWIYIIYLSLWSITDSSIVHQLIYFLVFSTSHQKLQGEFAQARHEASEALLEKERYCRQLEQTQQQIKVGYLYTWQKLKHFCLFSIFWKALSNL